MAESLVISCGGTGGHFYPGLSAARTLQSRGGRVLLLISGVNAAGQCAAAASFGIKAVQLPKMPSPSLRHPVRCVQFVLGFVFGTLKAWREIAKFKPLAALGMGSFASMPVLAGAWIAGVPLYLHDGNARIGRANRIASRFCRWIGTAFPAVNKELVHCSCEHSGMPLRPEILHSTSYTKAQAIEELNRRFGSCLEADLPTILIFGGSQGAAALNRGGPMALKKLNDRKFQVLHLAGANKIDEVKELYSGAEFPVLALPSTDAMELFYHSADLVISRSGGSTLAELFFFGKPSILVPYPYAAENHQWDNAAYALENDAAFAVENSKCTPEYMAELLEDFLNTPEKWRKRGSNAVGLARPNASELLLSRILI